MIQRAILTGSFFIPAAAQAHPGSHGGNLYWSLVHALTQPDHLLAMALVATWAGTFVYAAGRLLLSRSGSRMR
ncbi:MAG: HupE/UreJ family protein [Methylocystis sp.]|nr:HupE/UreJ family protein [Methylocystis sp.]